MFPDYNSYINNNDDDDADAAAADDDDNWWYRGVEISLLQRSPSPSKNYTVLLLGNWGPDLHGGGQDALLWHPTISPLSLPVSPLSPQVPSLFDGSKQTVWGQHWSLEPGQQTLLGCRGKVGGGAHGTTELVWKWPSCLPLLHSTGQPKVALLLCQISGGPSCGSWDSAAAQQGWPLVPGCKQVWNWCSEV